MEWISFIAGLGAFIIVAGFILWKNESAARKTAETARDGLRDTLAHAQADSAAAVARADTGAENAQTLHSENESLREKTNADTAQIAALKTELQNTRQNADEKIALLKEARESMSEAFDNLSQKILEEKGAKFGAENEKLLTPLKRDLENFRTQVQTMHTKDTADRSALKQQIENLQNNAAKYGQSADDLARALKGDSKAQGNWGEVVLENLLESSGLRDGEEYETQKAMRDEDGNLLRPDVVVKLPDGKHLIVDSKVSLRDYHDSVVADKNSAAEETALARHLAAVKTHIAALSGKHYARLKGANSPDFVFMFMPVEPAFFAAMREDAHLFSEAFDKKIVLCAPTTLMATLRTVERIWQLERQSRNAEEIARQGGSLYDKFVNFKESLDDIGAALTKATAAHEKARKQLSDGSGSLTTRANKLLDLGANTKKMRLLEKE